MGGQAGFLRGFQSCGAGGGGVTYRNKISCGHKGELWLCSVVRAGRGEGRGSLCCAGRGPSLQGSTIVAPQHIPLLEGSCGFRSTPPPPGAKPIPTEKPRQYARLSVFHTTPFEGAALVVWNSNSPNTCIIGTMARPVGCLSTEGHSKPAQPKSNCTPYQAVPIPTMSHSPFRAVARAHPTPSTWALVVSRVAMFATHWARGCICTVCTHISVGALGAHHPRWSPATRHHHPGHTNPVVPYGRLAYCIHTHVGCTFSWVSFTTASPSHACRNWPISATLSGGPWSCHPPPPPPRPPNLPPPPPNLPPPPPNLPPPPPRKPPPPPRPPPLKGGRIEVA